jgi:transcription initiation factor TFIID subunit TAF12
MIKNRKKITNFFESILCVKNEGIHKVIGILGIRIKIKNKHKEILKFFADIKKDIEIFKQQQTQQQMQQQMQQQTQQQMQQQQSLLLQQLLFYIEKENEDKK